MEPNNIPSMLSRFGAGLGRTLLGVGTLGLSEAAYAQRDNEQQKLNQLGEIIATPISQAEKVSMLSRLGTPQALEYAMQLSKPRDVPESIREFQAVQELSPEQQRQYQQFRNPVQDLTPWQQAQIDNDRRRLDIDESKLSLDQRAAQFEAAGRPQEAAALRQQALATQQQEQATNSQYNYGNVPDPLRNIRDSKRRDIETGMIGREAEKLIQEQGERVSAARAEKAALQRFNELSNIQGGTGGIIANTPGLAWAQRTLDPEVAELSQLQATLAPKQRVPGSGATSDYDAKQFERATVGPEKPTATNNAIIAARNAAADNEIAYGDFLESYRTDNGHTRGAEAAWRRYLDANPIFDKSKSDSFALNPKRQNWQQYFSKNSQSSSIGEGTIIENDAGQRMILKGGKWQNL
jgi:hypothetical protein